MAPYVNRSPVRTALAGTPGCPHDIAGDEIRIKEDICFAQ